MPIYHQGQTPEHIIQMYTSLSLEKVYLALGYYLSNRVEVDAYIQHMEEEAERLRQETEAESSPKVCWI